MLEIFEKGQPNIKNLVIDVPPSNGEFQLPFDPNADLTQSNREQLELDYISLLTGSDDERRKALMDGLYLSLIFPDRKEELVLDKLWEEAKAFAQEPFKRGTITKPLATFAAIKTLFPDRFSELEFPSGYIDAVKHTRSNVMIQFSRDHTGVTGHFNDLFGLGILDYKNTVEQFLPGLHPPTPDNLQAFFDQSFIADPHAVIGLRVFYPGAFGRFSSKIDWKSHRDHLRTSLQRGWDTIPLVASMTVKAAEEIRIDEKGLTINLRKPPSLMTPDPRMPERRRF